MQPPTELEAPHDPAVGGVQVYLHDGAFFTSHVDLAVPALFYDINWTRHYRSDATFTAGGLLGQWDFAFNKRIVPKSPHPPLQNGLYYEQTAGAEGKGDTPELWFYNGTGRGELYVGSHSERREVFNFDKRFRAYVTTYTSPQGQFHEIERYVLLGPLSDHPFREHPNVEKQEQIFYVLREKNGTRYVFNCRGQLIYILSRNDSPSQKIRVELDYFGELNPLTQNHMLSLIIDATGRAYAVTTVDIGQQTVFTNIACQLVSGAYPIPRIKSVRGAGLKIEYAYQGNDTVPLLEAVTASAGSDVVPRRWEYKYDGNNHITDLKDPKECAKKDAGKAYLHNDYSGEKVQAQTVGADQKLTLGYTGAKVLEQDAVNNKREYTLEGDGKFHVVAALEVTDADPNNGGPWTTRYQHNGSTQVTEITYPAGNGVTFEYDPENRHVTLGPIRDWYDRDLTYENNLALGNLLKITKHGPPAPATAPGMTVARQPGESYSGATSSTTQRKYELLYNQLEEATDPLGNRTHLFYEDYDTPKNRGNPLTIDTPPVLQPDGTKIIRLSSIFTYDNFAQEESLEEGKGRITKHAYYEDTRYIKRVDYPGGAFETLEYDDLGNVTERTTEDGTVKYERDGFGQVKTKTADPEGLKLVTTYDYDQNGNTEEIKVEVKDTFGDDAKALGLTPAPSYLQTLSTKYDLLNRKEKETMAGNGLSAETTYTYSRSGDPEYETGPKRDDKTPFKFKYRYDARHLLVETIEAFETDAARSTRRKYDDNGNLALIETGTGDQLANTSMKYNGLDRVASTTSPLGAVQTLVYDAAGNVTSFETKGRDGTVLHRTNYDYDAYRHPIQRRVDPLTGAPDETTQWFYSARLTLARMVSPNGGKTSYEYDDQDRVEHVADALGDKTVTHYDKAGNPDRIELTSVEQKKTVTTATAYDSVGRVIKVTTPAGEERRFLDSLGRARATLSPTGQLTKFTYDGLGRRTAMETPLYSEKSTYTEGGLVETTDGPEGSVKFTYDPLGRVLTRTDTKTKGVSNFHYTSGVVEATDPNGTKVKTTYNAADQPLDVSVTPSQEKLKVEGMPPFRLVQGSSHEQYAYDELGRITCAWSNNDRPAQCRNDDKYEVLGSEVRRKYDGLDRVTEEKQIKAGVGQTIAYDYDTDFFGTNITYPQLARARVHSHTDVLGRVDSISLNDQEIASYRYSGLDQLARRQLANGIVTSFDYDEQERLNQVQIERTRAAPGLPTGVLWSVLVNYGDAGPARVTEVQAGEEGKNYTVLQTSIGRDAYGRPLNSLTSQFTESIPLRGATGPLKGLAVGLALQKYTGLDRPTADATMKIEQSGAFMEYDGLQLKTKAEYGGLVVPPKPEGTFNRAVGRLTKAWRSFGYGGDAVGSLRTDHFRYDEGNPQRVKRVDTSGGYDGQAAKPLDSIAMVEAAGAGAKRTASDKQYFGYDSNGNLISDGRYLYAYDFKNRLVDVQDTWAPYGYDESVRFMYDAFDRRIAIVPDRIEERTYRFADTHWVGATTWLLYDGDHVIAEVWQNYPGKKVSGQLLLAAYVRGARPGELVRMDRRPEDDPTQPLQAFYAHEDYNGAVRFASDERGALLGIANDTPPGQGKTASEEPPGDREMIQGAGVRLPYVGAGTRIDGFAGVSYRDDFKMPLANYRGAADFVRDTESAALREARSAEQNKLQIAVGTLVALPISISVAPIQAVAVNAFFGGEISVGFGELSALVTGNPYSASQFGMDFLQGAAFGAATGVVGNLGLSAAGAYGAELVALTSVGTAWDVGVRGAGLWDSIAPNLITSVAISGALKGIGWVGGKAKSALVGVAADAAEELPSLPAALKEETRPAGNGEIAPGNAEPGAPRPETAPSVALDVPGTLEMTPDLLDTEFGLGPEQEAAARLGHLMPSARVDGRVRWVDRLRKQCHRYSCALQSFLHGADEAIGAPLQIAESETTGWASRTGIFNPSGGTRFKALREFAARFGFRSKVAGLTLTEIKEQLDKGRYVLAGIKTVRGGKHAVRVMEIIKDAQGVSQAVRFFDPGPGAIVRMSAAEFRGHRAPLRNVAFVFDLPH
ncbi:MAG TPA: DUF6531 domain-containing protein [Alphaproteobacteria bacterium]|nr:DUF6531 domain-containing protein [Alphaproteobacteria bacterium]